MPSSRRYDPTRLAMLFVILLAIVLVAARQDVWMTFLLSIAPLWLAVGGPPAPEHADEADLEQVVDRLHDVQEAAWRRLGALAGIIDVNHPGQGVWVGADVAMPLVESWPKGWSKPTPPRAGTVAAAPKNGLTTADVDQVLRGLHGDHRRLVVLGDEHTGKTSALLGLFLWAQHERSLTKNREQRREHPLPLRVSVAGWPPDQPNLSLLNWVVSRLQEDYPGLLAHGASLEELMAPIWEDDRRHGDRLTLFIDGIDTIRDPDRRRALLRHLVAETEGRSVALACRRETWDDAWRGVRSAHRRDWSELTLAAPTEDDVRARLAGTAPELADQLIAAGPAAEWLRENPRMLQLLQEVYAGRAAPAWLGHPGPDEGATLVQAWDDVLDEVTWPNELDRAAAVGTLRWMSREKLFASSRFAWWHVPSVARQDPSLARAWRSVLWRRAGSAVAWALGAFGLGLLALVYLLRSGVVQGYDRANGGVTRATGISRADVHDWPWRSGGGASDLSALIGTVVSNPVYLTAFVALLTGLTVLALARCGGEFEHRDGGQPQTIRLGLPQWGERPSLRLALPRRTLPVLFVLAGAGLLVALTGVGVGPAARAWPGLVFAGVVLLVLVWLQWCAGETEDFTPAGTYIGDREASRAVALAIGLVTAVLSAVLSWWLTSPGHVPTLGQCLWIIAALSTAAGLARGFYLGAGMGVTLLLPVRRGFGIGYGARLRMLQAALRRHPPATTCAPTAVIELFDLERTGADARSEDVHAGLLLRPVGSLVRLRESSLDRYLSATAPPVVVRGESPVRATARGTAGVLALGGAAAVALLTCTGTAAEVFPGLPCARGHDSVIDSALSSQPRSSTWLENGQCVGFTVLSSGRDDSFATRGLDLNASGKKPELDRRHWLDAIARENRGGPGDSTVTILFLAPLTRVSGSHSINALWQLEGTAEAVHDLNLSSSVNVRVVVANAGENFVSGASVIQRIRREFPSRPGDEWRIGAVIGIAQSRTIAREALAQLPDVPIVGGSVSGTAMRQGNVTSAGGNLRNRFLSVSPSNQQVAAAMLTPEVKARIAARLPDPRPAAMRLHVVRDPDDTYFSKDLSDALTHDDPALPVSDLREADPPARTRQLAEQMCSAGERQTVWLWAGRGNQLADLDHEITRQGRADCRPVVLAGPGGIAAVATSDVAGAELRHMRNLFFYTLADRPQSAGTPPADPATRARGEAQANDLSTGYASLVEAVRSLSTAGVRTCPSANPRVAQLGRSYPNPDGHNTLGPATDGCGSPTGSQVWFCPFGSLSAAAEGCVGVPSPQTPTTKTTSPKPQPVTADADRGTRDPGRLRWYDRPSAAEAPRADGVPWDTKNITVLCAPASETATDGWVGVYVRGRGTGFVHWKVHYTSQNRYLRFHVPDAPGFDRATDKISDHVRTTKCRTTDELDRLL